MNKLGNSIYGNAIYSLSSNFCGMINNEVWYNLDCIIRNNLVNSVGDGLYSSLENGLCDGLYESLKDEDE